MTDEQISTAVWQDCFLGGIDGLLPRGETPARPGVLDALWFDTTKTPSIPVQSVRLETTPQEFGHLLAALERRELDADEPSTDRPLVLGVSSSVRGEGKTTVALHLALTVARDTFKRVCLIDLSLTGDAVADRLGVTRMGGLVPAMEDESSSGSEDRIPALRFCDLDNLVVIPAGRAPKQPRKLARSPRVAEMIAAAREAFDVVVVDMPPVDSDNALPLVRLVDGVVMVARAGATPADVVAAAIDSLGRERVVGLVMNRVRSHIPVWLRRWLGAR